MGSVRFNLIICWMIIVGRILCCDFENKGNIRVDDC